MLIHPKLRIFRNDDSKLYKHKCISLPRIKTKMNLAKFANEFMAKFEFSVNLQSCLLSVLGCCVCVCVLYVCMCLCLCESLYDGDLFKNLPTHNSPPPTP